jgi:DNA repair protein RadC
MRITEWPESERPREKLLARGADALSDAELLAIFLRTGVAGKSAVDLARELLNRHGGLRSLVAAGAAAWSGEKGLGRAKFAQLQAARELGRRLLDAKMRERDPLTSPAQAREYLLFQLRDRTQEIFACLFLDTKHRVIAFEEMFRGTLDGAAVHPREVVKAALGHNAAAVIAAHNHPSGVAEPSRADELLTRRLKDALALVEIRLLDHLIVGESVTSLAEQGLL